MIPMPGSKIVLTGGPCAGKTTMAEVLYAGRDPFTRRVIVAKGLQADIKAGQPVIDEIGVVGQVTRVYPWLAEVTLDAAWQQVQADLDALHGAPTTAAGQRAELWIVGMKPVAIPTNARASTPRRGRFGCSGALTEPNVVSRRWPCASGPWPARSSKSTQACCSSVTDAAAVPRIGARRAGLSIPRTRIS